MSTAPLHDRPSLSPAVQTALDDVRCRIRRYVWQEGVAAIVVWLGVAFWATLAIDWFFEPPVWMRGIILALVGSGLAVIGFTLILRRAFVRITDANAANLLERRFPQLGDSLLTAVVLSGQDLKRLEIDACMLARTCEEANARIADVHVEKVFNREPLRQKTFAGGLLLMSIVFFVLVCFDSCGVWARRTLALSNELWPRNARIEVDGFEDGVHKIARGADLEVIARADMTMPLVPQAVEVRYRTEGGSRGRATMDRRGLAHAPEDAFQEYTYTFRSVLGDIHFDVVGGDDRVADRWIQVVDSPTISEMTLDCELPAYIGRKPTRLPVSGVMQVPMGSRLTVHAKGANKDLVRVEVGSVGDDRSAPIKSIVDARLTPDRRGFSYRLEPLMKDATLLFTLTDGDGIKSREPVRLTLVPLPDQSPQMNVQLDGIGSAVTPKARVAVAGRITDDYGIGQVWFEYAADDKKQKKREIAKYTNRPTELPLTGAALELQDLQLKPGQKLTVSVKAADLCALGRAPNIATSEQWILEVVTPEQMRAMLEARELILRQRFDRMIQEMSETRDLLTGLELGPLLPKDAKAKKPEAKPADAKKKGAEPNDEEPDNSPERRQTLRVLRVEGALTNCRKSTQEVLGLAEAFEDICKQLINNRIDTEELRNRLQKGIASPLRAISGTMFPELEHRLEDLRQVLDDAKKGPKLRDHAQQQTQEILLAMQKVRDKMIELEDFNEALELLRGIIQGQQQLKDQIQQRHKEKIRDLLKD
jgi:hypothetical protein